MSEQIQNITEEFREIPSIQGYAVSNLGRVKSLPKKINAVSRKRERYSYISKEKIIKTYTNKGGCNFISVVINGKKISRSVKVLIKECFAE